MSRSIFQSDSHLDVERRANFEDFDSQAIHIQERMLVCSTAALTSWPRTSLRDARTRQLVAALRRQWRPSRHAHMMPGTHGRSDTLQQSSVGDLGTFLATLSVARAQNGCKRRVCDAADRRRATSAVRSSLRRKSDTSHDTVATAATAFKNDTDNINAKLQGPWSRCAPPFS